MPVAWGPELGFPEAFEVELPRSVALRDALLIRGIPFVLEYSPPPSDPAEAAAPAEAPPAEPVEVPPPLATFTSTWRVLAGQQDTHAQQCATTLVPPAAKGRKGRKKAAPLSLTLDVTATLKPVDPDAEY